MTGGRSVDHDQVGLARLLQLADLAQGDEIPDPGGGGGHQVDGPAAGHPVGDGAQATGVEVVGQGLVGRDLAGPEPPSIVKQGGGVVRQGVEAERGSQVAHPLQLDQEHIETAAGRRDADRCPYRCLSNPALAGDDEDPR